MEKMEHPIILSIAGSDPSGGAGIQADLKTIAALGGYALTAVTALTVQNTMGVSRSVAVADALLKEQLEALFADFQIDAVKIGMLSTAENVAVVVDVLKRHNVLSVVCDPLMFSTSGYELLDARGVDLAQKELFPLCTLITPNLIEAQVFGGNGMVMAKRYGTAVLVKGGHADGETMKDVLFCTDGARYEYVAEKVTTKNLHGTGCTLSSAIATYLAHGYPLPQAVDLAKRYITDCIVEGAQLSIGHGNGPLWHFPNKQS
ncbi:MAG: bifunctional hydroxymethylpyrimidine kinase/phosphomethylpyrimidine kinase [Bacteroidales bacterium]|nr:bifunctional hydroxymethylpyrimidine kinase/phosphomethylpyrimidine kinase [Bacteroidales bacterium]